jgi:hypothetical protein
MSKTKNSDAQREGEGDCIYRSTLWFSEERIKTMGGSVQRLGDTSPSQSRVWKKGVASGKLTRYVPATSEKKSAETKTVFKRTFLSTDNPRLTLGVYAVKAFL